jgi:ABC-type molybdate transport system substrate-binding protein
VVDLARNFTEKSGFDWGLSYWQGQEGDMNAGIVESVNGSTCDMGVIARALRPDEAAMGLNQTIIANDSSGNCIVLITKGERPANVTRFIDFAMSEEGRAILAKDGFVPA